MRKDKHMLLDFEEFCLNQIIKIPTRENSILDLDFVCMGGKVNNISSYCTVQSDRTNINV